MFTSAHNSRMLRQSSARYLMAALLCGIFSAVYETFSHGVYSPYMVLLFTVPLLLGALPLALLSRSRLRPPSDGALKCWRAGIQTLTAGSCLTGVLEIYGTDSPYLGMYAATGALLLAAGAAWYGISLRKGRTGGKQFKTERS